MAGQSVIGPVPVKESNRERSIRHRAERALGAAAPEKKRLILPPEFPTSRMPAWGWSAPQNLRGPLRVDPPAHRGSSKVLGGAYPFLAETGDILTGAYIGENQLSRAPFCFDPWDAYSAEIVRSHSCAIIGVKGTGKSMLAKSWSTRLIRLGRKVAVPHDPNGEWVKVAQYVGGKSNIQVP